MMSKRIIYLDNAASTPMSDAVIQHMSEVMRDIYGNPSSLHEFGRRARVLVEQSRRHIARMFGITPAELFFTSGGTEANNAVLWGACNAFSCSNVITSRLEHPAVLQCLEALKQSMGITVHFVDVDELGHIRLDHLEELLKKNPSSLVSLMHANNETGNLLPVKSVASLCSQYNALFHSDTVQTVGKFAMDLDRSGIDFAVASAHKFHGPKGAGFMYIRRGRLLNAFIKGGGQERNMRAGTENVYGIAGMAKALEEAHQQLEEVRQYILSLKKECMALLKKEVPGIRFWGDPEGNSLHSILNIALPAGTNSEMLLPALDIEGICVSSGSACASGSLSGSHVLKALGADPAQSSLRISFSRYNTSDEVTSFVEVIRKLSVRK